MFSDISTKLLSSFHLGHLYAICQTMLRGNCGSKTRQLISEISGQTVYKIHVKNHCQHLEMAASASSILRAKQTLKIQKKNIWFYL
jgi:hypothetical protein